MRDIYRPLKNAPTQATTAANPNRKVFQSSNMHYGEYDPPSRSLTIHFAGGKSGTYHDVPPEVWKHLCAAQSPRSFLGQFIIPNYRYKPHHPEKESKESHD